MESTPHLLVHDRRDNVGVVSELTPPSLRFIAGTVLLMGEHIDLDVSAIIRREMTIDSAGDALMEANVRTANGRVTAAEVLGHREFVMTKLYRSA